MESVKTAISIPKDLFRELDALARRSHRPRSQVLVEALRDHLMRLHSKAILAALNDAYGSEETALEKRVRTQGKRRYARTVAREPW